ncbi:MAG: 23S rRNA (adenine(2503)-C(2))-methyltransferase RlmN [Gammaproteobacteria bacterium]|nr:23S rRNA (adenine(2503)-C(2))-methyltransferase RlmN [Gammaproteobacteria bacterium]
MTAQPTPVNLFGLDRAGVDGLFDAVGEARYRTAQIMKWLYHRGVNDYSGMTDLSKALRNRLAEISSTGLPQIVREQNSKDGTRKWVLRVANGNDVEAVLIPDRGRNTLCVSTQVGCMLDCSFCSTGKQGFNGNLSAAEIVGQVWLVNDAMRRDGDQRGVTNVVMMGMGEPLLNFDASLTAADIMMDDYAFGISKRRVTISTAGVVPAIRRLIGRTDVSLAVSLHAPDDELRDVLVPINRKYPIAELLAACRDYVSHLGERRHITIEYTLIRGVNDSLGHAQRLARLLAQLRCKINLIPFNPYPGTPYERPDEAVVRDFQTQLMQAGYATMLRTTRGEDIDAACGQLVGAVADRTRRSERHRARIKTTEVA